MGQHPENDKHMLLVQHEGHASPSLRVMVPTCGLTWEGLAAGTWSKRMGGQQTEGRACSSKGLIIKGAGLVY